jgi:hypothetical protein
MVYNIISTTVTTVFLHESNLTAGVSENWEVDFGEQVSCTHVEKFCIVSLVLLIQFLVLIDPPKAISDVVEAVLGAVHFDGGFCDGQAAALQLMSPILNVLLKARKEKKEISLKHPKKVMQELGGELLELYSSSESDFAMSERKTDVLFGGKWGNAHTDGSNFIATAEILGSIMAAVSDPSAIVGRNKACALIVSTLQMNPKSSIAGVSIKG